MPRDHTINRGKSDRYHDINPLRGDGGLGLFHPAMSIPTPASIPPSNALLRLKELRDLPANFQPLVSAQQKLDNKTSHMDYTRIP